MKIRQQRVLNRLRLDERGLTTVEYVIVMCLIAAIALSTWGELGDKLLIRLQAVDEAVDTIPDSFL